MTNSEFSFPSLNLLVKSNYDILSVVTNPPKAIGRKKKNNGNNIILIWEDFGIDIIQQKDLSDVNL